MRRNYLFVEVLSSSDYKNILDSFRVSVKYPCIITFSNVWTNV